MMKVSFCALICFGVLAFASFSQAAPSEIKSVDLIVQGEYVVTMAGDDAVLRDGVVVVDDGVIVDVGAANELLPKYKAKEYFSGGQKVVMPGLINGHSHAAMTLLRGIADDLSLFEWLNEYIFPAEVAFVDPDFVRVGTQLACWEMTRGGTTTFVDMYYHSATIAKVVDECGMRALVSATIIGQKSPDAEGAEDSLNKARLFVDTHKGQVGRVSPILGPHSNYTLNPEQLKATRKLAATLNVPISIHMAESPFELEYSLENYQQRSVEMFAAIGFLDGPTIAAHMVWPNEREISILADKKVGVIYNPTSNMKTAAGVAPILKMQEAGVVIGLGTDGAASNNDLDMWEEMRLGALLQKVDTMDPEALGAAKVLSMATIDGARAIGMDDQIGSLEVGKKADLIQVAFTDAHHVPTYSVISHLVYVTDEQDVSTVIVDGRVLMRDRELLYLDTDKIREEAAVIAAQIKSKLNIE